jgi:hypothetical protein
MRKLILIFFVLLISACAKTELEGCYFATENIATAATEKNSSATSWVQISVNNIGKYKIAGQITGANLHVCHLVPEEGAQLDSVRKEDQLIFSFKDSRFNMNCQLALTLTEKQLKMDDKNHHCSRLFSCGARVSLDGFSLSKRACENNQ